MVSTSLMGTAHLLRLLCLFTGISVLQQVKSWIISVPTTITAVEGSCVVVPCQTDKTHSRVIWYLYHKISYPVVYDTLYPNTVEQRFRGRTSVPGNAEEKNCSLMINNVRKDDDNLKVYVWIYPDSKQKYYDQTVTISVERQTPIISIQKKTVDGEFFQANCSIKHSCSFSPPPLQWKISQFLENSTLTAFREKVQGQWLHMETMQGHATYKMHNSKMRCSAQFKTFVTESLEITLSILYKPVTVTLKLEKETVMEGDSIIMECTANGNPQPHMYSWLRRQMGQITEINSAKNKMFSSNITRDTSLSCIAHNEIGVGQSDWLDLDVQYVPAIMPESSCHLTGEVLRCVCQAEASPNASIYWIIDGNYSLPPSFSSISTNKKNVVSVEINGPAKKQTNVSCIAWNSLGRDTKQLSIRNLSNSSYFATWLSVLMLLGIAFLFGCAMVIYRKYCRSRAKNTMDNNHQDERYNSLQRSQNEGVQSSPCGSEMNPEMDRLSCVYDNDFLEEMRKRPTAEQHKSSGTALQRQRSIQRLAKGEHCDMGVYLNC